MGALFKTFAGAEGWIADADVASPRPIFTAGCKRQKMLRGAEPTSKRFVSQPFGFFADREYGLPIRQGPIDLVRESRKRNLTGDIILAEGHVLVASTTERDVKGGDRKDVDTGTPGSGVKAGANRKRRSSPPKDEGHVSNALRSVYQRAVEEDIPAEMLDLLRKLD